MRWSGLLLLLCILCSCSPTSVTNEAIDGVNASINVLEETLPKECKTKAIEMQIDGIRKQITVVKRSCEIDVGKMRSDKIKWQTACFGLLLLIGLYIGKKFWRL